jgi:hypothetical protein
LSPTQREWLEAQESQRARILSLQAALSQLAARRPGAAGASGDAAGGGADSAGEDLAAKYRRVKAAARVAATRAVQLQGARRAWRAPLPFARVVFHAAAR